jgi:flagellar hook-associated protein 1 FlgK
MSDFAGLRIALSSLHAQRRAMEVTGQNVANLNTEGYSRQRVDMVAESGPVTPAVYSRYTGAGQGVRSGTVVRMRDQFMELRGYQEHAVDSGLRRSQGILSRVELAFNEPSDTGLSALLGDFWAGWDDVANNPTDEAARTQLVERAQTLANGFSQLDSSLAQLRQSSIAELSSIVTDVNTSAQRIAELNAGIISAVAGGFPANELMDQRDLLVSRLAKQVGVTVRAGESGTLDVFVAGTSLVSGTKANQLDVSVGTDPAQTVRVVWSQDGYPAGVTGEAGALVGAIDDVLPRYRANLSAVATQVANDVNALHRTGFALDGSTGRDFFTVGPTGISVAAAIAADPRLVAAASSAGAGLDGSRAQQIAELTGANEAYQELVVGLGVESQSVNRRVDVQAAIVAHVDDARESAAGVNLDEEMTAMVEYQHAYEAASRFLTAVDETLDTLINSTGRVGR